jgi:hypothetical protein
VTREPEKPHVRRPPDDDAELDAWPTTAASLLDPGKQMVGEPTA